MVMQRRCHVDEYDVCAAELPGNCVRGVFASVALSALTVGYAPDHTGKNSCHMADLRIRNMCGRKYVRTLDKRQIPTCGSITVGVPSRLYNAHHHVMQLSVATVPHNALDIFQDGIGDTRNSWPRSARASNMQCPHGVRHGCPITLQPNRTGQSRGPQMRTRRCPDCAKESRTTICR